MSDNPLIQKMEKIMPGTTIRLPSKGLFYNNNELTKDVNDGEIVLHPMQTLDEIIIRNPDGLFQGTAVEKVISRCAPQVLSAGDLFAKDVDYILIQLRKLSYGDEILINFTCQVTEDAKEHQYPININYFIKQSKELDAGDLKKYKITLNNGMTLNLRPSTFKEMVKMHQLNDETKTPEELVEIITLSLCAVIQDVDGVTNREHIKEWLKILRPMDTQDLVSRIADSNNYGPDLSYTLMCKSCNKNHDISYILNPVSFFMLPSSPETRQN